MKFRRPKKVEQLPLSATGIYQHLILTPDGLWAWFELGPQWWRMKDSEVRASILHTTNLRWSELAGYRVHLIRDTRVTDHQAWARQFDEATPNPLYTPGAMSFPDWLVGAQYRIAQLGLREPSTFLGVRVSIKRFKYADLQNLDPKTRQTLTEVTDSISREGFDGHPLTASGLGLLVHSMTGFGAPVPDSLVQFCGDGWSPAEMKQFTDPVQAWAGRLDLATTVTTIRDGQAHTRKVTVLEFGKMAERDGLDPTRAPWMSAADALPFPVVFSAQFDVIAGPGLAKAAEFTRIRAESVAEHYQEHGEKPPPSTDRAILDARRIEDEVKDGEPEMAVRLGGTIYAAVSGQTDEEVDGFARTLVAHYQQRQKIALHYGFGQFYNYRSFTPGESVRAQGFTRVLPAYYLPTALPNLATRVGDNEGGYLGRCGPSAPFTFDPTYGPRHNGSGLIMLGGGLGVGKSHTLGMLVELEAMRGHRQVIVDGSGLLARLEELPHLHDHTQHIELAGAAPGTLNPYWLVPDPRREEYPTVQAYAQAMRDVAAERRELATDTFLGLQHPDFVREGRGRIVTAISRTVNKFGGDYAMNPWLVVRELEHSKDLLEKEIGANLRDTAGMKGAALIFPEDQMTNRVTGQALPDAMLTIITLRGMQIPKSPDKRGWTNAERMVAPALHLVARYATLAMYADQKPKGVWVDEGAILSGGEGSIRSFLGRSFLESRKTNTALGVVMQNPKAFLDIDPEVGNLIGAAFVGRTTDPGAIEAWMRMLGIAPEHGYEKVFRGLDKGAGHFLHLDWEHNLDVIRIDAEWRPDLKEVLNTTPPGLSLVPDPDGDVVPAEVG